MQERQHVSHNEAQVSVNLLIFQRMKILASKKAMADSASSYPILKFAIICCKIYRYLKKYNEIALLDNHIRHNSIISTSKYIYIIIMCLNS